MRRLSLVLIGLLAVSSVEADVKSWLAEFLGPLMKGPSGGVRLEERRLDEGGTKEGYAIHARFPRVTGLTDAAAQNDVNKRIEDRVRLAANRFRTDALDWNKDLREKKFEPPAGLSTGMEVDYAPLRADADVISLLFVVSSYFAGAAHPNANFFVINYDLKKKKPVELADLFLPGSTYLQALSSSCIAQLKQETGETTASGMIDEEGASPRPDNFVNFGMVPEGLVIFFDPYQVASYAAGPQKVLISWKIVEKFLSAEAGQRYRSLSR